MSRSSRRRPVFALTAVAAGLLAALTTPAMASADEGYAGPSLLGQGFPEAAAAVAVQPIIGDPGFTLVPDPGDGTIQVESISGLAPFYTSLQESGTFVSNGQAVVVGHASFYSDIAGNTNTLFERMYDSVPAQIFDQFTFGSSGFANAYSDVVGGGPDGSNAITDIFITPFGDFNIPITYDAAALFDTGGVGAAAATDWLGVLEADWTTLVTDFGALF